MIVASHGNAAVGQPAAAAAAATGPTAAMASQRRRRREGAGKRARRLSSQALGWQASSPAAVATATEVATARAHRPDSSDGDGEADVEPATKKWTASGRMQWHGEQASTGNGKQLDWSQLRAVGFCRKLLPVNSSD